MSKAYALASMRSGFCLSNEEIISQMLKVAPPYPVNIISQKIIPILLERSDVILPIIEETKKEREYLYREISKIDGLKVFKSSANFILFRVEKEGLTANQLHSRLLNEGVIVRNRSTLPLLENCLRITVAPRKTGDVFLRRLRTVMER